MTDLYLGLDPAAANCGWAVLDKSGILKGKGTFLMKSNKWESTSMRPFRLRAFLRDVFETFPGIVACGFEDALNHKNPAATKLYGEMRFVIHDNCKENAVPVVGCNVKEIKVHATGHGGASKEKMMAAAKGQWDQEFTEDEADAAWVADLLREGKA